jgi:AraC family transcriptional regulator of adaptative response/methylated-DNA-[protein]-cysteine methyltransferase
MLAQTFDGTEPETLRFGYGETTLGTIAVAHCTRGLAALFIGNDRGRLLRDLQNTFPNARLVADRTGLAPTIAKATVAVDSPHLASDLPLDLRGSATEIAVWSALREIPAGETRSYAAIARNLPITVTAQEVGAACAANRLAVVVPCHRVVKSDGSISGYRWGVQRKRRLINMEGVA